MYISDSGNLVIRMVSSVTGITTTLAGNGNAGNSGDNGPSIFSLINTPYGISYSNNYVYFTDVTNRYIRRINVQTNIISRYAGNNGVCPLSQYNNQPLDIIID